MKGKPLTIKSVLTALNDVLRAVGLKDVGELEEGGKNALKGIPLGFTSGGHSASL